MSHPLHNPVYNALLSGDRELALGSANVKYFDETVSPFVGINDSYPDGFAELFDLLPPGRRVLFASPSNLPRQHGWQLLQKVQGVQMIFTGTPFSTHFTPPPVPLQEVHIEQMLQLTTLTKPGPFGPRTIDFGHYHGIFNEGQLVAMTGQRLHVHQFTELSAVCTHPDYLGKGYASVLVQHQVNLILQQGKTPFLHVRQDNHRAIALYERLGFSISRGMNFYVLKRRIRRRLSLAV